MQKIIIVLSLILGFNMSLKAQNDLNIGIGYGVQLPGGDLVNRFGLNNSFNINVNYQLKSNWQFGVEGGLFYGNRVKETSFLNDIATSNGNIINSAGEYGVFQLMERGQYVQAIFGKVFSISEKYPSSGILVRFGVGYMQHKIKLSTDHDDIPQIEGDYTKGYDQFSSGLMISQFIGYSHLSTSRRLNFYAGFEFMEGFTKNRRTINYDTMMKDNASRVDVLSGFRVGFVLSIRKGNESEYYYD